MSRPDPIIERNDLADTLRQQPPDQVVIVDLHGVVGAGKTVFLRRVGKALAPARDLALRIPLGESDGAASGHEPGSPAEIIQAHVRFRRILTRLGSDIRTSERAAGRRDDDLTDALRTSALALDDANLEARGLTATRPGPGLRERLANSQDVLAEAFADSLDRVLEDRCAVLTVDDFEHVGDRTLGGWLVDLAGRLPRTMTIVGRTEKVEVPRPPGAEKVEVPMRPLTRDEVARYLALRLPEDPIDDPLVDEVMRASSGVAGCVWTLAQVGVKKGIRAMRERAKEIEGTLTQTLLAVQDEPVREILRSAAALRSFDVPLLAAVLGRDESGGNAALDALTKEKLIEEAPAGFRLREFVRDAAEADAQQRSRDAWIEANRRAAEHLGGRINTYEEKEGYGEQDSLEAWRRYEQPAWQDLFREQLYYEARASRGGERAVRESRARFARGFLDGFFWWGCYIDFPFLSDLLADWTATQGDDTLTAPLSALVASYPTGPFKERDDETWDTVQEALGTVEDLCLPRNGPRSDGEQHLQALLDIFFAHTWRFRPIGTPERREEALYHYDSAIEAVRADDDGWTAGWVLFERAEVLAEEDPERARDDWLESARLLEQDDDLKGDHELAANLHRLAADLRWPVIPLESLAASGRAVFHAYLFNASPQPAPDPYTQAFYGEQVGRALDRLVEYVRSGGDPAAGLEALRGSLPHSPQVPADELRRMCAADDRAALMELLPAGPADGDLNRKDAPFMKQWRAVWRAARRPAATASESAW